MPPKRYILQKLFGRKAITDRHDGRVYAFGPGFDFTAAPFQQHRAAYTEADAQAVVDWMNERQSYA
jgi:hypothetical protein